MAPIKFEENIKEKLEKRTLQPTSQAWNKLSEKLDTDAKKSSNKSIWWLGLAASLVGILFLVNVFFKTSETNNQNPVLVDIETNNIENVQNENDKQPDESIVTLEELNIEDKTLSEEKIETVKIEKKSKNYPVNNTSVTQVETNQELEETINQPIVETELIESTIVDTNIQQNSDRTETDIDALLRNAQQNIANKNQTKSYAIDAQSLLQDVEEDLDESFRAKVFETIKSNYKKVKTAVAERNE